MKAMVPVAVAVLLALVGRASAETPQVAGTPVALVGARVVTMAGPDVADGVVLIRDGKIEQVGAGLAVPADYTCIDVKGCWVVPGFIDLSTALGGGDDLGERVRALTPGLRAADAFDPFARELAQAAGSGVTTFVLAADAGNVVGGRAAVIKMPHPRRPRARYLARTGPFQLSVGQAALQPGRAPTSRPGAWAEIRRAVREDAELSAASGGNIPVLIAVADAVDVRAAITLARDLRLRACLVGAPDPGASLRYLSGVKAGFAFGPFHPGMLDRQLGAPARVAAAGGAVAFASAAPRTRMGDIRATAVLAVATGLDRRTALRGLTLTAAELIGAAKRVGSLAAGKDADLVVLSGDPLELSSRIERVMVEGETIFEAVAGGASGKAVE